MKYLKLAIQWYRFSRKQKLGLSFLTAMKWSIEYYKQAKHAMDWMHEKETNHQ